MTVVVMVYNCFSYLLYLYNSLVLFLLMYFLLSIYAFEKIISSLYLVMSGRIVKSATQAVTEGAGKQVHLQVRENSSGLITYIVSFVYEEPITYETRRKKLKLHEIEYYYLFENLEREPRTSITNHKRKLSLDQDLHLKLEIFKPTGWHLVVDIPTNPMNLLWLHQQTQEMKTCLA